MYNVVTLFDSTPKVEDVVIVSGGKVPAVVLDLKGRTLCGVYVPATVTSTALNFKVVPTAATAVASATFIEDGAGSNIAKTISGGEYIPIDPKDFYGIRFLVLSTGTNEGANRTFQVVSRAKA